MFIFFVILLTELRILNSINCHIEIERKFMAQYKIIFFIILNCKQDRINFPEIFRTFAFITASIAAINAIALHLNDLNKFISNLLLLLNYEHYKSFQYCFVDDPIP